MHEYLRFAEYEVSFIGINLRTRLACFSFCELLISFSKIQNSNMLNSKVQDAKLQS